MNSPPLEDWFTGSVPGGKVSAALSFGPGAAALRSARGGAGCAGAVVGASAAAPVSAAPLRNLRRSVRGRSRELSDIVASLARYRHALHYVSARGSPAAGAVTSESRRGEPMRAPQARFTSAHLRAWDAQLSRFPSPHSRSEWRGGGRGGGVKQMTDNRGRRTAF